MDSQCNMQNQSGLKDAVVKLERCDKIWETLQLIRTMQDKHLEDIQDWIKREPMTTEKTTPRKEPPMTFIPDKTLPLNLIGEPNLSKPYIKYQPIFNNGDESLPQFQLSEKSRVNLYHCEICSQEYCDYKRFLDHQEKVHGISVLLKRMVTKKDKVQNKSNGDIKSRRNSADSNGLLQLNKKLISDENIDVQTVAKKTTSQTESIKCKLCGRWFKNIKKHMVEYHKIKYIGVLSKVTDKNSNIQAESLSVVEFESLNKTTTENIEKTENQTGQLTSQQIDPPSIQNTTNSAKRKLNMSNIGPRKRLRSFSSKEEESDTGNRNDQFSCDICGKEYANYKALCKHRVRHKNPNEDGLYSESKKNTNETVDQASGNKVITENSVKSVQQDTDSNDKVDVDPKIPRTRSSFTKERSSHEATENGSVISLERKEKNNLEIKCACGRFFRTRSILANHKIGCKFINDNHCSKTADTRSNADKESGISITIKKRNNCYEIVGKEGSNEERAKILQNTEQPEKNEKNIKGPEICDESSDSSSDTSDSSEYEENLIPEESKYSENHCILKLNMAEEDIDVDIEEYVCEENSSVSTGNNNSSGKKYQVTLLKTLCKQLLIQQGTMPSRETAHPCFICNIFLGSEERLSKHLEKHRKFLKRPCSCGIKFHSVEAFDDHIMAVHPKCISCPYCNEKYPSIFLLDEHSCTVIQGAPYTDTFDETHPCPNCDIAFNDIAWLDSHMRSKHLDPNLPFQCYQCSERFPNEIARSLHAHKKHNRHSACSVCNQKFQSIKTRQKHEAYHRGVGFPCHTCKKTYRTKTNQIKHVKTVHSDFSNDKLQCFICQKSIKTKSFKKHVLRHNSILECEICHKVLYDFRNLERHIMDHHGNENYPRKKCNVCGVSFPTKEQLEAHIIIENSSKKHKSSHV